jgi:hypothetical protein
MDLVEGDHLAAMDLDEGGRPSSGVRHCVPVVVETNQRGRSDEARGVL